MKSPHLIAAVFAKPWLITPAVHGAIRQLLTAHLAGAPLAAREGENICGDKVALDSMEIINGVARIPVSGVIGQGFSGMEKGAGATDVRDISRELREAEADDSVHAILFDIDSPGGMVSGTPELAEQIAYCNTPTYAFSRGTVASAAYWLASQTSRIFATRSAELGSIGVYAPFFDETAALAAQGYQVELFTTGKYKGMGFPGTSLSDEQRAELQAGVDAIFQMFKDDVAQGRDGISEDTMQGQTFMGATAVSAGLADEIVSDIQDVLATLGG